MRYERPIASGGGSSLRHHIPCPLFQATGADRSRHAPCAVTKPANGTAQRPATLPNCSKATSYFLRCYRYRISSTDFHRQGFTVPADAAETARPEIVCRRSFARVAHYCTSMPEDLEAALWTRPESLIENGDLLRFGGARQTVRLTWKSQPYVLKHYVHQSRRHALKQFVQPSRAWSTWQFTHRLADAGVATPRPVACIENRWGPLRRDSFLMYPYVEGRTLRSYFVREAKQSKALRDRLWSQLHQLWDKLRELHASLGDANVRNFIIAPSGQLWLIDLDRSYFHRHARAAAPINSARGTSFFAVRPRQKLLESTTPREFQPRADILIRRPERAATPSIPAAVPEFPPASRRTAGNARAAFLPRADGSSLGRSRGCTPWSARHRSPRAPSS